MSVPLHESVSPTERREPRLAVVPGGLELESKPVPLPDGLAEAVPGARLAELLAGVDVRRVSGFDTVDALKAAYRQLCHIRGWFLLALLEVGLREQGSGEEVCRLEVPDEFAPDEARAALVWSRRRSDTAFELAWNVHRRLPALGEAMLAGRLDEPRAVAFIRWTMGLTNEQAQEVCESLLGQAPSLTVAELIERIQRMVLTIDPQWAEKRYNEAVRRRRVVGIRNEDGTATVSGLDLPLDRAAAGCDRIDALARGCKRAGDRRPIDHIRADLFLGSLDGSFEKLSDEEIIAHVLAHPFVDADPADCPPEHGHCDPGDSGDDSGGLYDGADDKGSDGGPRGGGHGGDPNDRLGDDSAGGLSMPGDGPGCLGNGHRGDDRGDDGCEADPADGRGRTLLTLTMLPAVPGLPVSSLSVSGLPLSSLPSPSVQGFLVPGPTGVTWPCKAGDGLSERSVLR